MMVLALAVPKNQMRAKDYGRIVGVAWEDWKIEDRHQIYQMINTAVGINNNDMANLIDQMQVVMNQMQVAINEVNPQYNGFVFDTDSKQVNLETDYTVSSTHRSKIEGYFKGKEYSGREELGVLVRDAIVIDAGIDLTEYPMIERLLLDPVYAEALQIECTKRLNDYLTLMEEMKK